MIMVLDNRFLSVYGVKLCAKIVSHFDVSDKLWSRKMTVLPQQHFI